MIIKPKFKKGDRVSFDWGNTRYKGKIQKVKFCSGYEDLCYDIRCKFSEQSNKAQEEMNQAWGGFKSYENFSICNMRKFKNEMRRLPK